MTSIHNSRLGLEWGALTEKGVMGMCSPEDPFSRLSHSLQGSHLKQKTLKVSSQAPPFEKKWKF